MILGFSQKFPWGEPTHFEQKIVEGVKIHTIREDKNRRWKSGMKIHFATGTRTPNYNCFKEGKCTSIQLIRIEPGLRVVLVNVDGRDNLFYNISVKGFARNDGFDSTRDFWRWFDEPFEGVLIHWTDKRY